MRKRLAMVKERTPFETPVSFEMGVSLPQPYSPFFPYHLFLLLLLLQSSLGEKSASTPPMNRR